MPTNANSVDDYLNALPPERRTALSAVREVILANLPTGYEEKMQYGMIGYVVPHTLYPAGYHCKPSDPLPCAMLCSQKGHMALHLMIVYLDPKLPNGFGKLTPQRGKSSIWAKPASASKNSKICRSKSSARLSPECV